MGAGAHLEASEADIVVAKERMIDVGEMGLDGEEGLDDELLDLPPQPICCVPRLLQVREQ